MLDTMCHESLKMTGAGSLFFSNTLPFSKTQVPGLGIRVEQLSCPLLGVLHFDALDRCLLRAPQFRESCQMYPSTTLTAKSARGRTEIQQVVGQAPSPLLQSLWLQAGNAPCFSNASEGSEFRMTSRLSSKAPPAKSNSDFRGPRFLLKIPCT